MFEASRTDVGVCFERGLLRLQLISSKYEYKFEIYWFSMVILRGGDMGDWGGHFNPTFRCYRLARGCFMWICNAELFVPLPLPSIIPPSFRSPFHTSPLLPPKPRFPFPTCPPRRTPIGPLPLRSRRGEAARARKRLRGNLPDVPLPPRRRPRPVRSRPRPNLCPRPLFP